MLGRYQTFQSRVVWVAFPSNNTVFLQLLQNTGGGGTAQAEHIFNIPLKDGSFLAVYQDIINDPALNGSDAQILHHGVQPCFDFVRQQINPCAAVLFQLDYTPFDTDLFVRTQTV